MPFDPLSWIVFNNLIYVSREGRRFSLDSSLPGGGLGDILLTIPLLRILKQKFKAVLLLLLQNIISF